MKKAFTKEDLLELKIRRAIYRFILENPGLHLSGIGRRLNIPRSTLNYHLHYLEKQDVIITKKDHKYIRYFVPKDISVREKEIINLIRVETTRNVLLYIMVMFSASQIEIAKELDKHPTTVEFHIKRLLKHGIIESAPTEEGIIYTAYDNGLKIKREKSTTEVFYRIKEPKIYYPLIVFYKKGYYGDIISDTIFSYAEDILPNGPPKIIKGAKETIEACEKILWEILPHPYYA